jgi:thiamine-phosphate pyrophosphorylase
VTAGSALPSRLLFVACAEHAPEGLPALVFRAVRAGVRFLEIRRPPVPGRPDSGARLAELRACLEAAASAVVLVNDRVDLAVLVGADGAHVGQADLPPGAARRLLGPRALLGLSTHDEEQLAAAQAEPLDYAALGPIFPSATKSGHAAVIGRERLAAWRRRSRLPVVAIGGITPANAGAVIAAGADAVAVAAAVAQGDVEANVAAFRQALGEP